MRIPMVDLRPMLHETEAAWRANLDRLLGRMHFVLGSEVEAFERELAASFGARYAVGVGSGTAAIEQAVLAAGCRPKFTDIDPDTLLLDGVPRGARAVIPVHLYGQPAALPARRARTLVVQDACQAHGAPLRFSAPVAYSFYPTKNLPCLGDGGAVLTDSRTLAARLRLLRDGGRNGGQVSRVRAVNSRLDEMQACYLRAFLPRLAEWNAARARLAGLYDRLLADCNSVRPLPRRPGSVCHLYVVRTRRRERLRQHLASHGIATGIHYPVPLHLQPAFRQFGAARGSFPVAERACREILSLPLWPHMTDAMVEDVAGRIRDFDG